MQSYDQAYTSITKMGFSVVQHAKFDELGVVCYRNRYTHVILQNWDSGMTIETIENECQVIRSLLLELGANVWNAYYILCANSESIEDDQAFFIERNSALLRKYVIRLDGDLNRIPFLDDIPVNEIDNPLSLTESLKETDVIINTLVTEVKKLEGHTTSLNKKQIKDVVNLILSYEGNTV
jgi:hypothetical protein